MGRSNIIIDKFKIYDWKVVVLYNITCDDIDIIVEVLKDLNCPDEYIDKALDNLETCNLNSGLTYSNLSRKSSVIVVGKTSSFSQLINTICHEHYHLICHISKILNIDDEEILANLLGNLTMRSYNIIKELEKSRF